MSSGHSANVTEEQLQFQEKNEALTGYVVWPSQRIAGLALDSNIRKVLLLRVAAF